MVTLDEVRAVASMLPRSSEGLVRGRVKFRIGQRAYLSLSRDGATMGFAFPKALRDDGDRNPERSARSARRVGPREVLAAEPERHALSLGARAPDGHRRGRA